MRLSGICVVNSDRYSRALMASSLVSPKLADRHWFRKRDRKLRNWRTVVVKEKAIFIRQSTLHLLNRAD